MKDFTKALFLVVAYLLGFAALAQAGGCAQGTGSRIVSAGVAALPFVERGFRFAACVVKCATGVEPSAAQPDAAPAPLDGGVP